MVTTDKPVYKVIGTRTIRPDGIDKVTGRAIYGADIRQPGMLYGRVKRSPHAHAIIKRINTEKAAALTGVHAIVTAQDFGADVASLPDVSKNLLAGDKVLYRGHAIAAQGGIAKAGAE